MEHTSHITTSNRTRRSESGWTAYMVSTTNNGYYNSGTNINNYEGEEEEEEDVYNIYNNQKGENKNNTHKQGQYDIVEEGETVSDDSTASDASSGPSHLVLEIGRSSVGNLGSSKAANKHQYSGHKQQQRQMKQNRQRGGVIRTQMEEQEYCLMLEAESACSHVHGRSKARKSK